MTAPTGDQTRTMLRELVDAWESVEGEATIGVREHHLIGLTVYGLTAHTHALAHAVLALDVAGQDAGIVPLVRQAMECSITAVWLELAGYPAVLTVLREQSRQQRNLIDQFVKSGQVHSAAARESVDTQLNQGLQSTSKAGEKFQARCSEISGGSRIYAIYRALSASSHAGTSIVDLYLDSVRVDESTISDAPDVTLRRTPKPNLRDESLSTLLSMLVAASLAWSRLDRDRYMRTRLKELCQILNVAPKHSLTAHGLAQVGNRKKEYRLWVQTPDPADRHDS